VVLVVVAVVLHLDNWGLQLEVELHLG
jgi:hypothetical protein